MVRPLFGLCENVICWSVSVPWSTTSDEQLQWALFFTKGSMNKGISCPRSTALLVLFFGWHSNKLRAQQEQSCPLGMARDVHRSYRTRCCQVLRLPDLIPGQHASSPGRLVLFQFLRWLNYALLLEFLLLRRGGFGQAPHIRAVLPRFPLRALHCGRLLSLLLLALWWIRSGALVYRRRDHALSEVQKDVSALGEASVRTPMVVPTRGHLDAISKLMRGDLYIGRGSRQRKLVPSRCCNNFKVSEVGREKAISSFRDYLRGDRALFIQVAVDSLGAKVGMPLPTDAALPR